jgi:hypothetical protein
MSLAAALVLAAATATAPPPAPSGGVQLATAEARATIVKPAVVRQASGLQQDPDAPVPQLTRRGPTILVEFE